MSKIETQPGVEVVTTPPAGSAPIEPLTERAANRLAPADRMEAMEAEIFGEAAGTMMAVAMFREWDPEDEQKQEVCFERWKAVHGWERANEIRNIVRAAWSPKKDAPYALEVMLATYTAGVKKRTHKPEAQTLNVQVVQMSAPMPAFPTRRIDK